MSGLSEGDISVESRPGRGRDLGRSDEPRGLPLGETSPRKVTYRLSRPFSRWERKLKVALRTVVIRNERESDLA